MKTFFAGDISWERRGIRAGVKGAILPQAGVGRRRHGGVPWNPLARPASKGCGIQPGGLSAMKSIKTVLALFLFALFAQAALADEYDDTIKIFKMAGESGKFFDK